MTTDLNTLLTALYVRIDDHLAPRVRAGRRPRLTDSELLTLAVAQVLLGVHSEARWLRLVPAALPGAFPYLPGQAGYNKRLRRALPLLKRCIRELAADTDLWADPVWLVDSTPVECARSRPTVARSDLAGIAGYGYCPSHSRWFWGLQLHLVCTPAGLPITPPPGDTDTSPGRQVHAAGPVRMRPRPSSSGRPGWRCTSSSQSTARCWRPRAACGVASAGALLRSRAA